MWGATCPSRSRMSRSNTFAMASSSWSTRITPRPSSRSSPSSRARIAWPSRSTPARGSSMISRSGWVARARAMSTRCFCPPVSGAKGHRARSAMPTRARASTTIVRSVRVNHRNAPRCANRPDVTTSRTVAFSTFRVACCGTYPTRCQSRNRRSGVPNNSMEPCWKGVSAANVRSRVVLPEPFGPTMATASPAWTCRLMSRRIDRPPRKT